MQPPRHDHQVSEAQLEKLAKRMLRFVNTSLAASFVQALWAPMQARGRRRLPGCAVRSAAIADHDSVRTNLFMMSMNNENDQADRAISTGKLHALPHFHTRPINVVVFHGSDREHSFSGGFPA